MTASRHEVLTARRQHAEATRRGRMVKTNATTINNVVVEWLERIGILKGTAKKRFLKARKRRREAHRVRLERDPIYAARCAKRRRDYIRCRANSCHNPLMKGAA